MVFIHWTMVILITLSFISIEFRNAFSKETLFHDVMKT
ncbi:MAG: cytochrome B [Francisella endosymbiont of Hyalomma asiaticum]